MSDETKSEDTNPAILQPNEEDGTVTFHQMKGNLFRVIHSDGIWCSPGPKGNVHLIFFNERLAIPQVTHYPLTAEGKLGQEDFSKREGKVGYVRELEVDIVLSKETAQDLHSWLNEYLTNKLEE